MPITRPVGDRRLRRLLGRSALLATAASLGTMAVAAPAQACGGLIGENGTISLVRTTTLAAYHDGVERYVTSFEFTGEGEGLGSIVPLPDVPTAVERGGDWTLQRLAQEVAPEPDGDEAAAGTTAAADEAEVLLEAEIDALDITVLRGGGDEVGRWALENGFFLTPDAPEVLDSYARRSPVFMAARFDAARARDLGQSSGDGTPIMLTIPTDEPWVPLRILGLGVGGEEVVEADVFLLTDDAPKLLAGGRGLALERSEPAGEGLLADLRSDEGMGWVPDDMWFSHLTLETGAADLTYDLAIATHDGALPSITDAGVTAAAARVPSPPDGRPAWPLLAGLAAGGVTLVVLLVRRSSPAGVAG